jgi:hypothetical protein
LKSQRKKNPKTVHHGAHGEHRVFFILSPCPLCPLW